jgi:hypothetical protein
MNGNKHPNQTLLDGVSHRIAEDTEGVANDPIAEAVPVSDSAN